MFHRRNNSPSVATLQPLKNVVPVPQYADDRSSFIMETYRSKSSIVTQYLASSVNEVCEMKEKQRIWNREEGQHRIGKKVNAQTAKMSCTVEKYPSL